MPKSPVVSRVLHQVGQLSACYFGLGVARSWCATNVSAHQPSGPSVYKLQGAQWLLKTYWDTPSLVPHLRTILHRDMSLSHATLVTFSALDQWKLLAWKKLETFELDLVLANPSKFFREERQRVGLDPEGRDSIAGSPTSFESPLCTQLLYYLASWGDDPIGWKLLYELTHEFYRMNIPLQAKIPFVLPFYHIEKLLLPPATSVGQRPFSSGASSSPVFERKLGLEFLEFYSTGWSFASELDGGHYDKLALVTALTSHVRSYSQTSTLVTTEEGFGFLSFIHGRIITEELYQNGDWTFTDIIPNWLSALDEVQSHRPDRLFERIPGFFPLTVSGLMGLLKTSGKTSALVPILDSFKEGWDEVGQRQRHSLVNALSEHINSQQFARPMLLLLEAGDSGRDSLNAGVGFLTFVNNKLAEDPTFHRGEFSGIRSRWVKALRHIGYSHRLPPDHFRLVPEPGGTRATRTGTESASWRTESESDEENEQHHQEDQGEAGGEGDVIPSEEPLDTRETGDSVSINTENQPEHGRENEGVFGGPGADKNV
ncbi:hypothetical protein E1B28_011938 [Marasmius oreades]|uniref:Uncharacterized protein n=1 Tax=Marasmius oreades TaxID=181124 RepID=A0A9P7RRE2_9AGAR|nr:uncharacterized protein E1B28_011938 [Marasmius oreades]KAG7087891.1 hypothetical protein E1B28_011938 [Marasmius oreades]